MTYIAQRLREDLPQRCLLQYKVSFFPVDSQYWPTVSKVYVRIYPRGDIFYHIRTVFFQRIANAIQFLQAGSQC